MVVVDEEVAIDVILLLLLVLTTIDGNNAELTTKRFASFWSKFNESFSVAKDVAVSRLVLLRFKEPLCLSRGIKLCGAINVVLLILLLLLSRDEPMLLNY